MSFYIHEYKRRAHAILEDAIKTAIFIDENALEPFTKETTNGRSDVTETEKLSKKIFKHFQSKNISFVIHRFENLERAKLHLKNKDIVLLDWHLDGATSGEEYALSLLEEIVKENQIHFCCIYTNSKKSSVIHNCMSYFSGFTDQFCDDVLEEYQLDEEISNQINPFLDRLFGLANPNDPAAIGRLIDELNRIGESIEYINNIESLNGLSLVQKINCLLYASKNTLIKSQNQQTQKIDYLDKSEFTFVINNTIIIILNKDHKNDSQKLLSKIRSEIIRNQNSYLMMLGLEMQNQLKESSAFITGNILDVKNETIAYHWKQSNSKQNGVGYEEFIKQVMTEKVNSNINNKKFSLLNKTNLLKTNSVIKNPDPKQLSRVNTFYNGNVINQNKSLSYGDIFHSDSINSYFLCITALCDCLHPENIKNKFFFVKGVKLDIERAIDLSDEAFVSYIDEKTAISWVQLGKGSKNDKHKPVYIKPIQLYIPTPFVTDNKLTAHDWSNQEPLTVDLDFDYRFTLRHNYTQRIANHAFSHPIRVGIDFVKKS